jgi:hypothetical protein
LSLSLDLSDTVVYIMRGVKPRESLGFFGGNLFILRRKEMANDKKGWQDISAMDPVIVLCLGAIALFVYFVASNISLHG